MAKFDSWLKVIRPQFLVLSFVLIIYGSSVAYFAGYVSLFDSLIALVGLLSLHIAVNLFNEYYDFITGVDINTIKTPFNGGSGVLPAGLVIPKAVYLAAIFFSAIGFFVGIYFLLTKGYALLPILIAGSACVLLYTPHLTRTGLGEFAAGMGLGFLPVLGTYFVISEHFSTNVFLAAIPAGLLTSALLLLSEFPDYNADKIAGRNNLLMILGKQKALWVYIVLIALAYICVLINIVFGYAPVSCVLAFITIPLAIKTVLLIMSSYSSSPKAMLPALAGNVKLVLMTQLLIAIGYLLGVFAS